MKFISPGNNLSAVLVLLFLACLYTISGLCDKKIFKLASKYIKNSYNLLGIKTFVWKSKHVGHLTFGFKMEAVGG